jgi:hypothetical protein
MKVMLLLTSVLESETLVDRMCAVEGVKPLGTEMAEKEVLSNRNASKSAASEGNLGILVSPGLVWTHTSVII